MHVCMFVPLSGPWDSHTSVSTGCMCVHVCVCEWGPVKQMGTAAVLPRLFHDWIHHNKSILNAKMNTCKNPNCSTGAPPHTVLLYIGKHWWGVLLSISPASILHDYCSNFSKLLCSESIDLRIEEDHLKTCFFSRMAGFETIVCEGIISTLKSLQTVSYCPAAERRYSLHPSHVVT